MIAEVLLWAGVGLAIAAWALVKVWAPDPPGRWRSSAVFPVWAVALLALAIVLFTAGISVSP